MTDRELLEAAAKAAGYGISSWDDMMDNCPYVSNPSTPNLKPFAWLPLTDDGDALRLAVKLGLHARQFPVLDDGFDAPLGIVEVWRVDDDSLHVEFLRSGDDLLAATRRAIVRAAAIIGREME